jgi:PHD/YefM family antitoxin component YafN of YafNO toxin-antitoxin module
MRGKGKSPDTALSNPRPGSEQIGCSSLDFIKKFRYNFVINFREVLFMPTIRSSADLRNRYNEISTFCHTYSEPVFITKNGKGDLAVMSIESYEEMMGRFALYGLLQEGLADVKAGDTRPLSEALADIRSRRNP